MARSARNAWGSEFDPLTKDTTTYYKHKFMNPIAIAMTEATLHENLIESLIDATTTSKLLAWEEVSNPKESLLKWRCTLKGITFTIVDAGGVSPWLEVTGHHNYEVKGRPQMNRLLQAVQNKLRLSLEEQINNTISILKAA